MFKAFEYMFADRVLMFTDREHNFSLCKITFFFLSHQNFLLIFLLSYEIIFIFANE